MIPERERLLLEIIALTSEFNLFIFDLDFVQYSNIETTQS